MFFFFPRSEAMRHRRQGRDDRRCDLITRNFSLITDCDWAGLVSGGLHEKRLLNDLLDSYNVLERPVGNESEPLVLSFGLTLMQIIDVVSVQHYFLQHFSPGIRLIFLRVLDALRKIFRVINHISRILIIIYYKISILLLLLIAVYISF